MGERSVRMDEVGRAGFAYTLETFTMQVHTSRASVQAMTNTTTTKEQHTRFKSLLDEYQYLDAEMHKIIGSIDSERLYDRTYVQEIATEIKVQLEEKSKVGSSMVVTWPFDVLPDWAQVIYDGIKEDRARWEDWIAAVEKL